MGILFMFCNEKSGSLQWECTLVHGNWWVGLDGKQTYHNINLLVGGFNLHNIYI